jgi:hypothetical protein
MKTVQRLVHISSVPLVLGVLTTVSEARADLLEHWTTNQVSSTYGLACVVYADGKYVAYGDYSDYGVLLSSEDGLTRTLRSDGGPPASSGLSYVKGLCVAGNRFFALGAFGTSAVSSNGLDWTVFSLPNYANPASVAWSGSTFVAVGEAIYGLDFNVTTSPDGITWTPQHSTSPNGVWLSDVAYGAGKFVALGDPVGPTSDFGHSYTANALGITWTQHSIPGGRYITFSNGIFIVPLSAGTNLISTDGLAWAPVPTGITNTLGKVLRYNGIFVARAQTWLATSADGTNWVRYAHEIPGNATPEPTLATAGNRLVIAGASFTPPYSPTGFVYTCDELTTLGISRTPLGTLVMSGLAGRSNRVEFTDSLDGTGAKPWELFTNVRLDVNSVIVTDPSAENTPQRFYRTALVP